MGHAGKLDFVNKKTTVEYICVPDQKAEDKGHSIFQLASNGLEAAILLKKQGWSIYCRTTTWEKVEEA